jgi:peptidoglycan/xylan/chitin deacetylase (PgdA/CDA1 family)
MHPQIIRSNIVQKTSKKYYYVFTHRYSKVQPISRGILESGTFIISVDLELMWGATPAIAKCIGEAEDYLRTPINNLLTLLERFQAPATFAVVGHLFRDHCEPSTCPTGNHEGYSENGYPDPYSDIDKDPLFYGRDIIDSIVHQSVSHDLGYHSFSHPHFPKISRAKAEREVCEAKKIEREWGVRMKSFVFPFNEIGHVDVIKKYGFTIYRGTNAARYHTTSNVLLKKVYGGVDKLISHPVDVVSRDGIWEVQSSMYFSDYTIPQTLYSRACSGLKRAVAEKRVFHIFFHCWDLQKNPYLMHDLERLLEYVKPLRRDNLLEVMTMASLPDAVRSRVSLDTN